MRDVARRVRPPRVRPLRRLPLRRKAAPAPQARTARDGSKSAKILALVSRSGGATAKELMAATNWLPHSVRGFIAGTLRKKMGLNVISAKGENGERSYTIEA